MRNSFWDRRHGIARSIFCRCIPHAIGKLPVATALVLLRSNWVGPYRSFTKETLQPRRSHRALRRLMEGDLTGYMPIPAHLLARLNAERHRFQRLVAKAAAAGHYQLVSFEQHRSTAATLDFALLDHA